MFKLCYLKVNYNKELNINPTLYSFTESVYIYGQNSVGKTIMIQAIDFILGKSDFEIIGRDGFENIESFEAKLANDTSTLFLFRSKNNNYGYKFSENDQDYLNVDENMYKKEITKLLLNKESKYFEEFKTYLNEDLSFRTFSFINFLDEKGLGNLSTIFPRINSYYNLNRARKLMSFVFNYNNVHKICELTNTYDKLATELKQLQEKKIQYNYSMSVLKKEFTELEIPFDSSCELSKMLSDFNLFKTNFSREEQKNIKNIGDLGVLLRISCSLSEELKYQMNLKEQFDSLKNRNSKSENMLLAFKELAILDENYSPYIKEIETLIRKQQLSYDILSLNDFDKTIEAIKKKKNDIDRQISICNKGLSKDSYENIFKAIGRIEQAFSDINNIKDLDAIFEKEEELKKIENDIRNLKNEFDDSLKKKFDNTMLSFYSELSGIKFVSDDLSQKEFKMHFNPVKITVNGERIDSNFKNISKEYLPGSMARQTTRQIIVYLTMFEILRDEFPDLPIMPALFIDGLDQPYDDEKSSYPNIYKFVHKKAKEKGIQLFVVSTRNGDFVEEKNLLHIQGFNKSINNVLD